MNACPKLPSHVDGSNYSQTQEIWKELMTRIVKKKKNSASITHPTWHLFICVWWFMLTNSFEVDLKFWKEKGRSNSKCSPMQTWLKDKFLYFPHMFTVWIMKDRAKIFVHKKQNEIPMFSSCALNNSLSWCSYTGYY